VLSLKRTIFEGHSWTKIITELSCKKKLFESEYSYIYLVAIQNLELINKKKKTCKKKLSIIKFEFLKILRNLNWRRSLIKIIFINNLNNLNIPSKSNRIRKKITIIKYHIRIDYFFNKNITTKNYWKNQLKY